MNLNLDTSIKLHDIARVHSLTKLLFYLQRTGVMKRACTHAATRARGG